MVWKYQGEIDKDGMACGFGVGYRSNDPHAKWEGTWFNNKRHGL